MIHRSIRKVAVSLVLASSLVACQSNSSFSPIAVASAGPFQASAMQSLSLVPTETAMVTLPSSNGYGGTASLPAPLAAATTTLTETIQNTAPTDGTPALSQRRRPEAREREDTVSAHTTLLYFKLVSSVAVQLSNSPTFALNVPPSTIVSGASYEIAYYDSATQTWDAAWEGPATISGTTLTFGTNNLGTFAFAAGATNWFALLELATATPTPAPTASVTSTPVATASPTPVATATPTPVVTATPTPVATTTPTPRPTATPTPRPTATPTPRPTATPTPRSTATPTPRPTATPTPRPTATPTPRPTATPTPRPTATPTPRPTATPTPTAACTTDPSGAPVVCSYSPTQGSVGSTVTITGTNFVPPISITFGGNAEAAGSFTSTKIDVTVPAGALTGPITVQTNGGTAQTGVFTVIAPTPTPM